MTNLKIIILCNNNMFVFGMIYYRNEGWIWNIWKNNIIKDWFLDNYTIILRRNTIRNFYGFFRFHEKNSG